MLLRSSDGELKEDLTIGYAPTLGTTNGVIMDSSRLNKETAESTTTLLEESPSELFLIQVLFELKKKKYRFI
jgi:hypothetical protein